MPHSKQFTTVTTLSKLVALALFVTLPFIGFFYGFNYAAKLCRIKYAGFTNPVNVSENKNEIVVKDFENNVKQVDNREAQNESYYLNAGGVGDGRYYSINILPGWEVQQEKDFIKNTLASEYIVIAHATNPMYKLLISQGGFSGARCIFDDSDPPTGTMELKHSNYVDLLDANNNVYRRGVTDDSDLVGEGVTTYNICQYVESEDIAEKADYYLPTKNYELIRFETPTNPDEELLNQMDQMFESLFAREPETL